MGTILIAAAVIVVAGAIALWLARWGLRGVRRTARLLATVRRARRREFDQLAPGPVALRGRILGIDLIDSPVSDTRGACYVNYIVERWDSTPNNTGLGGKWICDVADAQAAPFELSDGKSAILVDPGHAELLAPRRPVPSEQRDFRIHEAALRPGDEVVVLGQAREEGGFGPSSAYRGHGMRLVVGAAAGSGSGNADGRGLVIVPAGAGQTWRLVGSLAGHAAALLPAATAAIALVVLIGNALPQVEVSVDQPPRIETQPPATFRTKLLATRSGELPRATAGAAGQEGGVNARVSVRTLGWSIGDRAEQRLRQAIRTALWQRRLDVLLVGEPEPVKQRRWLLFEERSVEGVAFRRASYWRTFCRLYPRDCR